MSNHKPWCYYFHDIHGDPDCHSCRHQDYRAEHQEEDEHCEEHQALRQDIEAAEIQWNEAQDDWTWKKENLKLKLKQQLSAKDHEIKALGKALDEDYDFLPVELKRVLEPNHPQGEPYRHYDEIHQQAMMEDLATSADEGYGESFSDGSSSDCSSDSSGSDTSDDSSSSEQDPPTRIVCLRFTTPSAVLRLSLTPGALT